MAFAQNGKRHHGKGPLTGGKRAPPAHCRAHVLTALQSTRAKALFGILSRSTLGDARRCKRCSSLQEQLYARSCLKA
eukprot:10773704-Alexandrium_andersonii.AAC.1